jgi:hypothetical protein
MKSHAMAHDGPRDRALLDNGWRTFVWLMVPPPSRWPRDAADVASARVDGSRRLGRVALKLPAVAALLWIDAAFPGLHDSPWVEAFWALWLTWLAVSSITDFASVGLLLSGLHVDEAFDAPPIASSPRDFWARRWNLVVHAFLIRYVFVPVGGRRRPLGATALVFACSGLMHEYFVVAVRGAPGSYTGFMFAFFCLQGAAVVGQMARDRARRRSRRRVRPWPRPLSILVHLAWLTATGPLFFLPLGEMLRGVWP